MILETSSWSCQTRRRPSERCTFTWPLGLGSLGQEEHLSGPTDGVFDWSTLHMLRVHAYIHTGILHLQPRVEALSMLLESSASGLLQDPILFSFFTDMI